jgi:hypothetical protein
VSDDSATTSLAPFAVTVVQMANGLASLARAAPTIRTAMARHFNLAGYRIHYGTTTAMTQVAGRSSPGIATYMLGNPSSGTGLRGLGRHHRWKPAVEHRLEDHPLGVSADATCPRGDAAAAWPTGMGVRLFAPTRHTDPIILVKKGTGNHGDLVAQVG